MPDTPTCEGSAAELVSASEALSELQKVLESQRFSNLERLRNFLRYVVEETLSGRSDQLKEMVIAMEAFGRDGSYDPRLDATVRVQAGRLRLALKEYYETQGRDDPVIIGIPKGSYAPVFLRRQGRIGPSLPEAGPSIQLPPFLPRKAMILLGFAAAALAATGIGVGVLLYAHRAPALTDKDTIVLADFANTTGDPVFDGALKQALSVGLEQSPFLNILSDQKIAAELLLMGRAPNQTMAPEVARELCQRVGGKVMLSGSIGKLDNLYVIGVTAANCATGDTLDREQVRAESKAHVLKALDEAASRLRAKLGESLTSVQKYDTPLEQATTPSLPALQAYSAAIKARRANDNSSSILLFQRAIELDPNFAMAYSRLGVTYFGVGQPTRARDYSAKAFQLRGRVTEHERLYIESHYYHFATGQLEKAAQVYEQWKQLYPHDSVPSGNLAVIGCNFGNYEAGVAEYGEALRKDPDASYSYTDLAEALLNLNRVAEASAVLEEMQRRKLESVDTLFTGYLRAFLRDDGAEMQRQLAAGAGNPTAQTFLFFMQSDTEAYHGRLAAAREFTQDAVAWAIRAEANEMGAVWQINAALREAEFGNSVLAAQQADAALALSSGKDVRTLAALTFARASQGSRARQMASELEKEFPSDTMLHTYWLPTIEAAIEIDRNNPAGALGQLRPAMPYELGQPPPFQPMLLGPIYPAYLRGQALLIERQGGAAAVEFRKLIDHPGVVMNYPLAALARLGLARSYALQNDSANARASYGEFFALWRDADPGIPVFQQAKAEYLRLK
jgi:tetratricopeptide (TPR) repeat protein